MGYEGAGEVQAPVPGAAADRLGPGDRGRLRHAKAGEPAGRRTEYWVLPAAAGRAKDPGLTSIAYSLLPGVASLVAGVVLGLMNSYRALFALVGLVTVIARITVTRVRSVSWPPIPNRYEAAY